jgi:hypothetical protein
VVTLLINLTREAPMIDRGGEAEREVGRLAVPVNLLFVINHHLPVSTKLSPLEKNSSQTVGLQVENEMVIIAVAQKLFEAHLGIPWSGKERREAIEVEKTMV